MSTAALFCSCEVESELRRCGVLSCRFARKSTQMLCFILVILSPPLHKLETATSHTGASNPPRRHKKIPMASLAPAEFDNPLVRYCCC